MLTTAASFRVVLIYYKDNYYNLPSFVTHHMTLSVWGSHNKCQSICNIGQTIWRTKKRLNVFCHVRMVRIDLPCDISHVSLLMTHDVFAVLTIEAIFIVYCLYD